MSKNKKQKYIFVSVLIIFLFSTFWAISDFEKKKNTITTPSPLLVKEGVKTTIPKPKAVNPPLLSQGGESLPAQAGGGNSVEAKSILETPANTEFVRVLAGETIVNLSFAPNTTFYDALIQAKNQGQISFAGKNYTGLGFFVTDIGTLHSGGGKDLLYYVNGKEASVGVSNYILRDGDIIEWKLE